MRNGIHRLLNVIISMSLLLGTVSNINGINCKAANINNQSNLSEENILMSDDMSSLQSGWNVSGVTNDVYIHDQQNSASPADKGQFVFSATGNGASTADVHKSTTAFEGSWALKVDMNIINLQTSNKTNTNGFVIEIIDNLRNEYSITLNNIQQNASASISLKTNNNILTKKIRIPKEMHNWKFIYDNELKILNVFIDDQKEIQFEKFECPQASNSNRIALKNVMDSESSNKNHVCVDSIELYKQHDILYTLISPESSALKFEMKTQIFTENASDYTSGKLQLFLLLENNNGYKREQAYPVTSQNMNLIIENLNVSGDISVTIGLTYDGHIVTKKNIFYYLYDRIQNAKCSDHFTAAKGAVLFDDFSAISSDLQKSGWAISQYHYAHSTDEKFMLVTNGEANDIEIPVTFSGNFGIYIGYVNGTNALKVKACSQEKEVVLSNTFIPTENLYSNNVISEAFIMATNFNGSQLILRPSKGKNSRIAYIKLVPFTKEEMQLYQMPNADNNGFMMDNDGFTDFYNGLFSDEISLRYNAIEKLAKQAGVNELVWCAGTTGMLNYNSPTIWKLFEGASVDKTPENLFDIRDSQGNRKPYDYQLRKGDIRAREDILNFQSKDPMHNNPATWPISILADEGIKNNVKVCASLRMRNFYNESDSIMFNGQIFYQPMQLSYEDPKFLDYIKSLVLEMSNAPNVDSVFLDFGRYPFVFPMTCILSPQEKSQIVTNFLKELRKQMPNKKIYARILIDQDNSARGLDYELWIHEKLIDRLITTVLSYENFYDFSPYLKLCHDNDVEYYLGICANQSGTDLTVEEENLMDKGLFHPNNKYLSMRQYLERTYEGYRAGVDGIYLFNTLNDLQFVKNINPKFQYLGDKIKMEKWHQFEIRADYINNSIDITKHGVGILDNEYTGLGSLSTTVSPIIPIFNPEIHDYTLSVPYYFDSLELKTSTFVKGAIATVYVNEKKANIVNGNYQILLDLGENIIEIKVTSANGKKTSSYHIKALRKTAANQKQFIDERAFGDLYPIVYGNADGTFKPDQPLKYSEAMQMVANILKHTNVKFPNKPQWVGKWYSEAMDTLYGLNLLKGINITNPDTPISRADFTAIIARILNLNKVTSPSKFTDISGHQFENEITALNEAKYIMGFADGIFKPESKLTRAEACVILCRILNRSSSNFKKQVYKDVPYSHWAAPYINAVSGHLR